MGITNTLGMMISSIVWPLPWNQPPEQSKPTVKPWPPIALIIEIPQKQSLNLSSA
jgi:hypothetical protein